MGTVSQLKVVASLALTLLLACSIEDDLTLGRGYGCDPAALDVTGAPQCAEGWRCGSAGRCIEDVPVERNSCVHNGDCPGGFVCGRDFQCRDAAVNGPYLCVEDADCGPSWRCGVSDLCIDPALDAPPLDGAFALLDAGARISPAPASPPDHLSISYLRFGNEGDTVAQSRGAQVDLYRLPPPGISTVGGALSARLPATKPEAARVTLPGAPLELAALHPSTALALLDDGLHRIDGDGGTAWVSPELSGLDRMVAAPYPSPVVVAWSDTTVAAGTYFDGGVTLRALASDGAPLLEGPAGAGAVLDVGVLRPSFGSQSEVLVAVTEGGVYVREGIPAGTWQPLAVGGLLHPAIECSASTGQLAASRLVVARDETLNVLATANGGPPHLVPLRFVDGAGPTACTASLLGKHLALSAPACPVCPDGTRLAQVSSSVSRCEVDLPDGGVVQRAHRFRTPGVTGCGLSELEDPARLEPLRVFTGVRETQALAGPTGRLFANGSEGGVPTPLTLWRTPTELRRVRGQLSAVVRIDDPVPGAGPLLSGLEFVEVPGFGLSRIHSFSSARPLPAGREVSARYVLDPTARTVLDARGWEDGGVPTVVATLDPTVNPTVSTGFRLPANVQVAEHPDGGATLVVSSFDVLLAADLAETSPVLTPRLAPMPRLPIRHLTLMPGPQLEGYALGDSALVHFRAVTAQRWEQREIPLPDGDPAALARIGPQVWVVFRDGRVFTLPGRLQIAPALEGERVEDVAALCGRLYAATSSGLRRLELGGNGQWQPEPLFAPLELAAAERTGARLFTGDRELLWAGAHGTLLRFTAGAACPD